MASPRRKRVVAWQSVYMASCVLSTACRPLEIFILAGSLTETPIKCTIILQYATIVTSTASHGTTHALTEHLISAQYRPYGSCVPKTSRTCDTEKITHSYNLYNQAPAWHTPPPQIKTHKTSKTITKSAVGLDARPTQVQDEPMAANPSHARAKGRGPDSSPLLHSLVFFARTSLLFIRILWGTKLCMSRRAHGFSGTDTTFSKSNNIMLTALNNSQKRQHPAESNIRRVELMRHSHHHHT